VIWPNCVFFFQAGYDESELRKIAMTSFQWHHHNYITKLTSQFFPIWSPSPPPNQNFWLRQCIVLYPFHAAMLLSFDDFLSKFTRILKEN